ncbi:MAG: hypothetical protein ACREAW_03890, partial [Nitrososphaera sp.]
TQGLITRLIRVGAVDRRINELRFSSGLCLHLARYDPGQCLKDGEIKGWRKMLADFAPELAFLSDEEVSITITLLDYFLNEVEAKRGY